MEEALKKTVAYLDCPTGIAGDMCLGALVNAGVPLEYLRDRLVGLGIAGEYALRAELVHRNGQQATKVHVDLKTDASPHRHLPDIEAIINGANLPERARDWSLAIFRQLAIAEGAVHGKPPERVHFHEVGAVDALVDVVGTCLGLDYLNIEAIYCSPLPVGGGTVRAAHGRLPVPVPAVVKLWEMRQVPTYSNGIDRELVTPTGAAIATTLAKQFQDFPAMAVQCVGLGAGTADLALPNILRLWLGEMAVLEPTGANLETVAVLETQLDDLSPQAIAYASEALFAAGALDVFTCAIGMKKSRSGTLLTVICHPEKMAACEGILYQETTTLGIRRRLQERSCLPREIHTVATELGPVRVKVAYRGNSKEAINVQPEYEDCAQLARESDRPWQEVWNLALAAWSSRRHLA